MSEISATIDATGRTFIVDDENSDAWIRTDTEVSLEAHR